MPVVELCGTPRLDWQHGLARTFGPRRPPVPVVAFSFHWDCRVAPEAGATWPYWVAIRSLAGRWETIGHAHPRAWNPALIDAYARAEVPTTHDFLDILDRASVYVCDNSSTMYEFAALDRPVICLDGPKYRRDVEHGLRFYDAAPGPRLADPARLGDAIARTILYPHEHRETRAKAMLRAYGGFPDGHSTQRAVAGIREHLL
jgi:CDP-glycerol glycerophosphotransferase (TagB/SpsB family)